MHTASRPASPTTPRPASSAASRSEGAPAAYASVHSFSDTRPDLSSSDSGPGAAGVAAATTRPFLIHRVPPGPPSTRSTPENSSRENRSRNVPISPRTSGSPVVTPPSRAVAGNGPPPRGADSAESRPMTARSHLWFRSRRPSRSRTECGSAFTTVFPPSTPGGRAQPGKDAAAHAPGEPGGVRARRTSHSADGTGHALGRGMELQVSPRMNRASGTTPYCISLTVVGKCTLRIYSHK